MTDSPLFEIVQRFFQLIGVGLVIFSLWKGVKGFAKADFAGAVKVMVGGIIGAALCFNLNIPIGLVNSLGGLVQSVFDTLGGVANGK